MEKYAHCVRSTLIVCEAHMHAKHAKTRGVWGHAPPENFENVHSLRLNLRAFSPSKHAYILLSNFYLKLHKL